MEKKKETQHTAWMQILKFTLFSLSAGIIQIAVFELMYDAIHINYWVSYLTGLLLSVVWNFTFNRKFTFKSANNIPLAMTLVLGYYAVFTPLSTLWGNAMESAGVAGILVTIFSMVINFITEFLFQKFVVFREHKKVDSSASEDPITSPKDASKELSALTNDKNEPF